MALFAPTATFTQGSGALVKALGKPYYSKIGVFAVQIPVDFELRGIVNPPASADDPSPTFGSAGDYLVVDDPDGQGSSPEISIVSKVAFDLRFDPSDV
jgi:hypothetical protein